MSKKEGAINSGEEGGDLYLQQHQSSFCCQCEKRRDLYVNSDVQGGSTAGGVPLYFVPCAISHSHFFCHKFLVLEDQTANKMDMKL